MDCSRSVLRDIVPLPISVRAASSQMAKPGTVSQASEPVAIDGDLFDLNLFRFHAQPEFL